MPDRSVSTAFAKFVGGLKTQKMCQFDSSTHFGVDLADRTVTVANECISGLLYVTSGVCGEEAKLLAIKTQ